MPDSLTICKVRYYGKFNNVYGFDDVEIRLRNLFFYCKTKDTTNKKTRHNTYNITNDTLLILLTIQYFLRIQFLHYFYSLLFGFFFAVTHLCI